VNWLNDNPVGRGLLYVNGALLLLMLVMAIAWSLPVKVADTGPSEEESEGPGKVLAAREMATMNELQVVNQRPLFNENRLPMIDQADVDEGGAAEDEAIAVKEAPEVKLTGVIITMQTKLATLTPTDNAQDFLMVKEGESLVGDFLGWKVVEINPRSVMLRSNDGQQLELKLQVHDVAIKQPPRPAPQPAVAKQLAATSEAASESGEQAAQQQDVDEQPQSRAEQIRQRIAERREQLRQEQEAREAAQGREARAQPAGGGRQAYQDAIRGLMQNRSQQKDNSDDKDG
jgi:hypothetical protein